MPKHDGQATVARRELQCSQRVDSEEAAAPQLGQLSDCAAMTGEIFRFGTDSASADLPEVITQLAGNYASQFLDLDEDTAT